MDKLEKLFAKVGPADRERILEMMRLIMNGMLAGLDIKKVKGTKLFRVRKGRYRIFFYRDAETNTNIIVDVRLRNENTY